MAIDPITAKIIAQAVASAVTDKNNRKKVIGVVIGIFAAVLLLLAIPIYLLSHPLPFLSSLFGADTSANEAIAIFKTNYDTVIPANNESVVQISKYCLPLKGEVTVVRGYESGVHGGIDLAGTPYGHVITIADGTVVASGTDDGIGTIKIKHTDENGEAFYSMYHCLFAVFVIQGETVTAEQRIGLEGGETSGDAGAGDHHLHFELHDENDVPYDPYNNLFEPPQEKTTASATQTEASDLGLK